MGEVIASGNYSWETRGSTSLEAVEFVLGVKRKLGRMEPDHCTSHMPGENAYTSSGLHYAERRKL